VNTLYVVRRTGDAPMLRCGGGDAALVRGPPERDISSSFYSIFSFYLSSLFFTLLFFFSLSPPPVDVRLMFIDVHIPSADPKAESRRKES